MNWTPETRLRWALRLVGIGFMAGILLSWNLWTSRRDYPLFPVADWIPQFAPGISALVALAMVGLLIWLVVRPQVWSASACLGLFLFLALQDQSRWQPWAYQYALMLVPVLLLRMGKDERAVLGLLQFIVMMVYLWGGIHKCQSGWLSVWENSLVAPLISEGKEGVLDVLLLGFGYLIPIIEILMAVGLLFRRTRLPAIVAIVVTHLVILALLGPVKGYISNSVVWPWNLVMVGMVICLFYQQELCFADLIKSIRWLPVSVPLVALMIVCPILFYLGLWDRYLSFSLYAGQQKRFLVQVPAEALPHVPEVWIPYLVNPQANDGHRILSPSTWSTKELNVPLISEWRILRAFAKELCAEDLGGSELRFYIDHRHLPDKPKQYFECDQVEQIAARD